MLFLIDYENVGNAGMRGSSYLNAMDHVIVFYQFHCFFRSNNFHRVSSFLPLVCFFVLLKHRTGFDPGHYKLGFNLLDDKGQKFVFAY